MKINDRVTIHSTRLNKGVPFKVEIIKIYDKSMNLKYPLIKYKNENGVEKVCCN